MSNIKQRVAKVEQKRTGGVVIVPDDGAPVIRLDSGNFQFEGMCYPDLKSLPPGKYSLWSGPEVDFVLTWDHDIPWIEAIEAMKARGEIYRPFEARP